MLISIHCPKANVEKPRNTICYYVGGVGVGMAGAIWSLQKPDYITL